MSPTQQADTTTRDAVSRVARDGTNTARDGRRMAFLTLARIDGEPSALLAGHQESARVMTAVGRDHGLILHAVAPTPEGLLIVNLWPSAVESRAAAADPRRNAVRRRQGLGSDVIRYEHYQVADHVVFDRPGPS